VLAMIGLLATTSLARPSFDIPRVDGVTIDGKDGDWGGRGLYVDFMSGTDGSLFDPNDLHARCRIGWDAEGLLVLVRVADNVRDEGAGDPLGRNDSVEIFVSNGVGSSNRYQYSVAAGEPGGKPRGVIDDRRAVRTSPPSLGAEMAAESSDGAYVIEARLPWTNLGRAMELGDSIGFQVRANDTDKGPRKSALWLPRTDSYHNVDAVQKLVLAEAPSPPIRAVASGEFDANLSCANVGVNALPELEGKDVEVRDGDRVLKRARLTRTKEHASAALRLPMPPLGEGYGALSVAVDGAATAALELPDVVDTRHRRLMELPVVFSPSVFSDAKFPRGDFQNPHLAQQMIGPYDVRTTFYDREYNVVETADKPGRYGAVIEFVPNSGGRTIRRFRTIYRARKPLSLWRDGPRTRLENPESLGLEAFDDRHEEWTGLDRELLDAAIWRDTRLPAVLDFLNRPAPAGRAWRRNADAVAADRQWWVGLKRKLNGWDVRWPAPFVSPQPLDGTPAPVLREGSLQEAGVGANGVKRIDELCRTWAADSDEGFVVCIARRGVIILHQAYGTREGRAMTVNDKGALASITKVFSGVAMMMLIDQGFVGLDDPVEKYLPAFSGANVSKPATIRHLYTHTAGLWGHWGDERHDFDEAVGEYYPRLRVGKKYEYNGASQALGGKILEAVTGEALPAFYLKHLLEPLGMTQTDVTWSASGAASTAIDLAKFGQMLLNGGAYGDMRFLRRNSLEAMMPRKLSGLLGTDTSIEYGLGVTYDTEGPFGAKAFGHGAASNTLLRVSPENELVLVMVRNAAGANYGKYEAPFLRAVAESIGVLPR
jgi:CubicO group peptidase (beta-lactamase class C family)